MIEGVFFVPAHPLWQLCAGGIRAAGVPIVPILSPRTAATLA
ncbi:hypothetical protein PLUA15_80039 [Pseudomonas lundensis]|uniref:Uncharacterized protein n=1 Tax=Pseudomonas lundensis TaxID=86185 RepID=A0AAX2HET0_9PSED|nr:hypothetical protein PLUA15_80039 [Pseudomonas lundensis]